MKFPDFFILAPGIVNPTLMTKRIVILGDFNPAYSTHLALNESTKQVKNVLSEEIQFDWIGTDTFHYELAFAEVYGGLWLAPGSPYNDMNNVINAIRFTRENNIPTFGNCGGFQHMIIEFARNVCLITGADHEETNPDADELLISKLACSLVQQQEQLTITDENSLLFRIIGKHSFIGKYYCSYGINSTYLDVLRAHGLKTPAISDDNHIRAIEIENHPFFLGTLFQPALTSTQEEPDPLILDFVKRAISWGRPRIYTVSGDSE